MSSTNAGSSGIGESWRSNSGDSTNSGSVNDLMRTCVLSYGARGSVMFEVDSGDSP